jgi:hypothetical protein
VSGYIMGGRLDHCQLSQESALIAVEFLQRCQKH